MGGERMKCRRCRVRRGLDCLGETTPALCRDVEAGRHGRAEQLVALAEGRPLPGAVARPTSEIEVRLAMLAELCVSGTGPCGCGTTPRSCGHPDRPSFVFRKDCIRCQERIWWESGVEAGW
jgi:hypothetical protein